MQYIERYARQIMLPEIGFPGQLALAQASVLIVGAGGAGLAYFSIPLYGRYRANRSHRRRHGIGK